MKEEADRIVEWLRREATAAGARGFVVGLSGGVDSAVVARLCQAALPETTLGVMLPCHSDPQDEEDARLVARTFGLVVARVALEPAYNALIDALERTFEALPPAMRERPLELAEDVRARVPIANLKPRLRMTALYFFANTLNYLVAGTSNRSEIAVGYFTKYGDGGADLLPIGHLDKTEVLALARTLGVPDRIVDKPPSAGLWAGQTDEGELGFTYRELEAYLREGPEAVAPALALKIERLMRLSEHKRQLPPTPPARDR
jgi:NAD+ synthase